MCLKRVDKKLRFSAHFFAFPTAKSGGSLSCSLRKKLRLKVNLLADLAVTWRGMNGARLERIGFTGFQQGREVTTLFVLIFCRRLGIHVRLSSRYYIRSITLCHTPCHPSFMDLLILGMVFLSTRGCSMNARFISRNYLFWRLDNSEWRYRWWFNIFFGCGADCSWLWARARASVGLRSTCGLQGDLRNS